MGPFCRVSQLGNLSRTQALYGLSPSRCCALVRVLLATTVLLATHAPVWGAESCELTFAGRQSLPDFEIDGRPARIHTQGLYVTDRHYYVTGRLESEPKRAMLVRFERSDPSRVEAVDITPGPRIPAEEDALDHPGGFDFDGESFWIPVAVSQPHSRTAVVRIACRPERPLAEQPAELVFHVDDHIGALAFDRNAKRLYGANWDTKVIFVWEPNGRPVRRIPREELVEGDSHWALAVQDWKSLGTNRILAGGLDKRSGRDRSLSPAVIEVLDVEARALRSQWRLPSPPGTDLAVTHEGIAFDGTHVFLLPGDLGAGAEVFRYRWAMKPGRPGE